VASATAERSRRTTRSRSRSPLFDDLELAHHAIGRDDGELERVHRHAAELEHVVGAAVDRAHAAQWPAARARLGIDRDHVGDREPDQRLDAVEQVRDEQP
jgi:hypothetical protein